MSIRHMDVVKCGSVYRVYIFKKVEDSFMCASMMSFGTVYSSKKHLDGEYDGNEEFVCNLSDLIEDVCRNTA